MPVSHETIVLLDFGAQYTQLIARRVREAHVYCEILPFNTPLAGNSEAPAEGNHSLGRAVFGLWRRRAT